MVFNFHSPSFSSSGRSEEPAIVVQSDLTEERLSLRSSLLRLNGCCRSETDWFLVCPFISDGALDAAADPLDLGDWRSRKQVALGVARGLAHSQEKARLQIQSILLVRAGEEFVAIPGDFGSFKGYPELHGKGIRGYGVMLLQLLTGEEPSFLLELVTLDGMNPKCCAAMIALRSPRNHIYEEAEELARLAFCCAFGYPYPVASMYEHLLMSSPDPSDGEKSKSGSGSTPYYSLFLCSLLLGRD